MCVKSDTHTYSNKCSTATSTCAPLLNVFQWRGILRILLARCILSRTSMYSCSCLTAVMATASSLIISSSLFWYAVMEQGLMRTCLMQQEHAWPSRQQWGNHIHMDGVKCLRFFACHQYTMYWLVCLVPFFFGKPLCVCPKILKRQNTLRYKDPNSTSKTKC